MFANNSYMAFQAGSERARAEIVYKEEKMKLVELKYKRQNSPPTQLLSRRLENHYGF